MAGKTSDLCREQVWRRSTLVSVLFFSIFAVYVQCLAVLDGIALYKRTLRQSIYDPAYTVGVDDLSFRNYTERVARGAVSSAIVKVRVTQHRRLSAPPPYGVGVCENVNCNVGASRREMATRFCCSSRSDN